MIKWKCNACGRVITDEEYQKEQECGSGGSCFCDFSAVDKTTGEIWYPRELHDMVKIEE